MKVDKFDYSRKKQIIIDTTADTSQQDWIDLKILLEELKKKYPLNWHVNIINGNS